MLSATDVFGSQSPIDEASNAASARRGGVAYGLPSGESRGWTSASRRRSSLQNAFRGDWKCGRERGPIRDCNLYQGTSATLGADKKIGTTGTAFATVAGGAFSFLVEATQHLRILSGSYTANIAFGSTSQFTTTVVPNMLQALPPRICRSSLRSRWATLRLLLQRSPRLSTVLENSGVSGNRS